MVILPIFLSWNYKRTDGKVLVICSIVEVGCSCLYYIKLSEKTGYGGCVLAYELSHVYIRIGMHISERTI